MVEKYPLSWYEASLPACERKQRGHFSTPPWLVERILDACGYTPERNLSTQRVLDPACGSGNFLIEATRRLLTSMLEQRTAHVSEKIYRQALYRVQSSIWGLDPDPVACCMAQMGMGEVASNVLGESYRPRRSSPLSFHIHQADGLAVPWDGYEGVDLFLANPPYLASKNSDLSGYRSALQRGPTDSYLLFLELALRIVCPGGWLALVLPDPVLARINASRERQRLLAETSVQQIWHLARVFGAQVGAVVLIAQKRSPERNHQIMWLRQRWQEGQQLVPTRTVAQTLLAEQPHAELRYLLGAHPASLPARLHHYLCTVENTPECEQHFVKLAQLVEVHRGEEVGKDHSALLAERSIDDAAEYYPVLRGGSELKPYAFEQSRYWLERQQIAKPLRRYTQPKLLVVKSTPYVQAALDMQQHVVLQTLYLLILRDSSHPLTPRVGTDVSRPSCPPIPGRNTSVPIEGIVEVDELYFLLALLNSRLLREYVYALYTAYKWVQPQIEQHVLSHLPIPCAELIDVDTKREIIARAKLLEQHAHACLSCQQHGQCTTVGADVSRPLDECDHAEGVGTDVSRPQAAESCSGDTKKAVDSAMIITNEDTQRLCYHRQAYHALYEQQERAICALYEGILQHSEHMGQTKQIDKGVVHYG